MNSLVFNDYYEILQVNPNADIETIESVYRLLAKKYHPDNPNTGNVEKFETINEARQALVDPPQRAAYDATYEDKKNRQWQMLSSPNTADEYDNDIYQRRCLLSILYAKCRENPLDPGVGSYQLEKMLSWPENVMEFHFWYLKEKKYIRRNDSGQLTITASGVDKIEEDGVVLGKDLLIPEKTGEGSTRGIEGD